ncbi:hypothetical protein D3C76_1417720 [compost metagenome]
MVISPCLLSFDRTFGHAGHHVFVQEQVRDDDRDDADANSGKRLAPIGCAESSDEFLKSNGDRFVLLVVRKGVGKNKVIPDENEVDRGDRNRRVDGQRRNDFIKHLIDVAAIDDGGFN